jgi:hypothetical protein
VTLYFASNGHPGMGGLDIFKATQDSTGKWKVENMQAPINSMADDFGITFAGIKRKDSSAPTEMMRVEATIFIHSNIRHLLFLSKGLFLTQTNTPLKKRLYVSWEKMG